MSDEKQNDTSFYGGSDPMAGAKRHKMTVILKDQQLGQEEPKKEDITKSDMFLKLFGSDAVKSFQKLEAKKELEKPRIRTIKEASPEPEHSSGSKR